MHLFTPPPRPAASYTCPACRQINVLAAADIDSDEKMVTVNCLACDREHSIDSDYMKDRLR